MAKRFRPWDVDQILLLPPSIQELVPEGHVAHFVRSVVRDSLDLSAILESYQEERGFPPYHPVMMTALLLYAYTQGVYSSRRIARGCEQRVDFMAVTAMHRPDFRTINSFRHRHLEALGDLFLQVLELCRHSGMVSLGHVSLDGTKIRANASKRKSMSYSRMKKEERRLRQEVAEWFRRAEAEDAMEDELYGEARGDELPAWVTDKKKRLAKIEEAKKQLEAEAKQRDKEALEKHKKGGRRGPGRPRKHPLGQPRDNEQKNFTDPESRIMNTSEGYQQCYNAQLAVDAQSQVIVARELTFSASDARQLIPLVDQIEHNTGHKPNEVSADSGYCSENNLEALDERSIRAYIATGKQKHGKPAPTSSRPIQPGTRRYLMQQRLKKGGFRSRYRLRKQTVEPVIGQAKEARGFRRFLLRGSDKVRQEWSLVCLAHNLLKLHKALC